jgi:Ser/Thr protein kinase RdoA (MazF antagonist)
MSSADTRHEHLLSVLDAFGVEGTLVHLVQWTGGHINQTYVAGLERAGTVRTYVLQRINSHVFPDIAALMDNAIRVSEHATRKLAATPGVSADTLERGALRFLRTRLGEPSHPDISGDAWRVYPCVERATAKLTADSPNEAYEAAKAFGLFQRLLADLPGDRLRETIPGFHDTPRRFAQLDAAARSDPRGRARTVHGELQACDARRGNGAVLQQAFAAGAFPERIVHNDAKLSNVLLDETTRKAVCVIDLDTVMPGYALHDFGDLARSICNPADEAETDLSRIEVRLPFFEALVAGYLDAAADMLTSREVDLLPDAGWVLTIEVAARFLADYLNGDVYFRIKFPEHNLARTRAQLTLARRLEEAMPELRAIVRKLAPARS